MRNEENAYQSWLWGEVLLFGLVCADLALFARKRTATRRRELIELLMLVPAFLLLLWIFADSIAGALPSLSTSEHVQPRLLTAMLAARALASLLAVVGFGLRFRARSNDL